MQKIKPVQFRHHIIDPEPAGWWNDITLLADINRDGFLDVVIGGKYGPHDPPVAAKGNLVWYEYPSWERHVIGCGALEAGGAIMDITKNGKPDIVAGEEGNGKNLYWWQHPGRNPRKRWQRRLITDKFERYHDQVVGDVDGDGADELVVLSQNARKLFYFDIPRNPKVEPWPEKYCHIICDNIVIEGLRVADIDGDGVNEIIAGHSIFKRRRDKPEKWERRMLLDDFGWTRTAVGDLNGDGLPDIVFAEAETSPARLLWLEGPDFKKVHALKEDGFHLHSLELADFNGNGALDIFCGEMHLGKNNDPKIYIFLNDGRGNFKETAIECPQGIHEAKVGDVGNTGRPSIVGKPYYPHRQVDWWENITA